MNSNENDRNVVFVEERGQIRPASAEERVIAETLAKADEGVAA